MFRFNYFKSLSIEPARNPFDLASPRVEKVADLGVLCLLVSVELEVWAEGAGHCACFGTRRLLVRRAERAQLKVPLTPSRTLAQAHALAHFHAIQFLKIETRL